MGVNGVAAARTLLSYRNIRHGYCLYYVWQAYRAHGARTNLSSPTAYDAWLKSGGKHPGDRNPPAGVPVFWGPKPGSAAGDVVISLGNGRVACTDYPVYGQVGSCTIAERERQIGRPYLGWTERIFDAPIDFKAGSGGGSSKVSQDVKNRQSWMNKSRGEKLKVDGLLGPATTAAIKRYQTFLKKSYGYKGAVDGLWGPATQASHQKYYNAFNKKKPAPSPAPKPKNPFGIKSVKGLQKIARLYGYKGAIDDIWGSGSAAGFAQFLRNNYGYKGNDTLGPVMWASIAKWLRAKYKYTGNNTPGPVMRAALSRANLANYQQL